jgi:hypothetical protein
VTQPLTDPTAVMAMTARLLAEHLDVDRCAYAEIEDEDLYVIIGDHTRGVPSIVGRWPVAVFGDDHLRAMLANEAWVVDNVDTDPRTRHTDLTAYRATTIRAVICLPLHKHGKFTAAMAVHQSSPRRWTADEIALVRTVVDRCWEALERARVARTLPAGLAMIESDAPVAIRSQRLRRWWRPSDRAAFQRVQRAGVPRAARRTHRVRDRRTRGARVGGWSRPRCRCRRRAAGTTSSRSAATSRSARRPSKLAATRSDWPAPWRAHEQGRLLRPAGRRVADDPRGGHA